jgi:hypothetical protein
MHTFGADGHAEPDFSRALGDRHQENIHDPDTADNQRDGRDAHQHQHHRPTRPRDGFGNVLHGADREVIFIRWVDVMPDSQKFLDVFRDRRNLIPSLCGHKDDTDRSEKPCAQDFSFGG